MGPLLQLQHFIPPGLEDHKGTLSIRGSRGAVSLPIGYEMSLGGTLAKSLIADFLRLNSDIPGMSRNVLWGRATFRMSSTVCCCFSVLFDVGFMPYFFPTSVFALIGFTYVSFPGYLNPTPFHLCQIVFVVSVCKLSCVPCLPTEFLHFFVLDFPCSVSALMVFDYLCPSRSLFFFGFHLGPFTFHFGPFAHAITVSA